MADTTVTLKRIIDLVTRSDVDDGVYTIIDSVSGAVKKYPLGSFICSIAPVFDETVSYAAGDICNYNGQLYKFTSAHSGAWTGTDAESITLSDLAELIPEIQDTLETKADVDGTYPLMTAGMAQTLETDDVVTESKPYLYRKTGADAVREYDEIVGGSVVVNQLVTNGNFADGTAGWNGNNGELSANAGKLTYTPTASTAGHSFVQAGAYARERIAGHKYLYMFYASVSTTGIGSAFAVDPINETAHTKTLTANTDTFIGGIVNASTSGSNLRPLFYPWGTASVATTGTETATVHDVQIIDLTQMFGSAIADYAYTLEQATAGAGIAWLKSYGFFADDYTPYNAGSFQHVSGLISHDVVGFNQWDEETESGYIDPITGAEIPDANKIRMKNYMPVLPNTAYYKKTPAAFHNVYFDANKQYISYGNAGQGVFTTPPNCHFIRSGFETVYGTTYKNDICINLSNPQRNGQYEPYVKHSYPLDSDVVLRGIPKLTGDQMYYDGDVYSAGGAVNRKYAVVNLGTLDWVNSSMSSDAATLGRAVESSMDDLMKRCAASEIGNMVCNKYVRNSAGVLYSGISGIAATDRGRIKIYDTAFLGKTNDEVKSMLSSVMLVYELATPTTESATPYQTPQICDPDGTEQYVGAVIPVGHNTQYPANLVSRLEKLPDIPTTAGTYNLQVTVTSGKATAQWVSVDAADT